MKFVHAADLHLDSPLLSLQRRDARQVERMRRATRDAFTRLVDLCVEEAAAFLLIAGDLYDHDAPNMQVAVFLRRELRRLQAKGIRCVCIKGNHDAQNKITSALALPDNTRVLGERAPETVIFDDLPVRVAVHGRSFPPGPVPDNLAASYPAPLAGACNIGLLHTSLAGSGEHDVYAPCALEDLTSRGYDYWALGHIHRRAVVSRDPLVVFPGNLQGRHARESGAKGCYVVEVDGAGRPAAASFAALDVVRWLQADVDLAGEAGEAGLAAALRAALEQAWREADGRAAAVRVVLAGATPLHDVTLRRPDRVRQTVLELADEIAGDDMWIEKIVNHTAPPAGVTAPGEEAQDLIGIMHELAANAAVLGPQLARELEPLRTRLPGDLKEHPALKVLHDPALVGDLFARLKPRLATRLGGEEDA